MDFIKTSLLNLSNGHSIIAPLIVLFVLIQIHVYQIVPSFYSILAKFKTEKDWGQKSLSKEHIFLFKIFKTLLKLSLELECRKILDKLIAAHSNFQVIISHFVRGYFCTQTT